MIKANMIKILEAMEENNRACAEILREGGNERAYQFAKGEASGIATVIQMLRHLKFAKKLAEIYGIEL